ncbi:hypothetical protein RND71_012274 [Anisodus tanguticus]|uniref:Uncharacterized protein n=1 Tax=Anisodus tanguticus TaxID=243964 RepID=A0AAE1VGT2_9SOLA|nr:hypothetical protein RND71_012274 [Anisodus tanguticus]
MERSILVVINNFSNATKLGRGGFGPVYKRYLVLVRSSTRSSKSPSHIKQAFFEEAYAEKEQFLMHRLCHNIFDSPYMRTRFPVSNSAPTEEFEANLVVDETFDDQISLPSSPIVKTAYMWPMDIVDLVTI